MDIQNIMKHNNPTILAINPGTRYIGIAVLKGTVLFDWSVKVMSGKLSREKLKKTAELVSRLIDECQPDILILKRLHPSRSSDYLDRMSQQIEKLAFVNGIKVSKYSIQELETFFVSEVRINKTALAELMSNKHPVLCHDFKKEQDNFNPYHIRMFEAVALGTMAAIMNADSISE